MNKQNLLFDDDSDEEVSLKTENEYAKKYDRWREKEELHKLEQKYGSKSLDPDASLSSDSEDDDEPPEVSEEVETQFLKTLALLKTKDPRIYDPSFKCFEESKEKESEKDAKTKTLMFADSDEDDDDGNIFSIEKKAEIVEDDKKQKKSAEVKEGKIKEYLIGQVDHLGNDVEKDLAPLKALWSDPKLNEGEAFLRDYILNKSYLNEGDVGEAADKIRDDEELEADEERVEEQGKFERAYNFRFEEPDQEYLKRFPRTMNYIRPKDERRARKRAELRTRKEEEKQRKMEEIARLKALKLKEIQEKIAKIKEVTGNDDLAFREEDLESDFDPEEHDKRMKEIFDEQYYGDVDEHKPVFPELDEELEIENWDNYQPEQNREANLHEDGPHCEDEDFNMDADYDPKTARENLLEEVKKTLEGKKRRNRKKKSKLAQLLESEKPKFVPSVTEKSYDQYMEEYYKMDCEDIIGGDLPTRFKYREVVPNDYGLSVEEILLADDKELTQWVPLKKILKHRPENLDKGDAKTYTLKAADVHLKKKILPSLFKDLPQDPEIVVPIEEAKKKKKKENKNRKREQTDTNTNGHESLEQIPVNSESNDNTLKSIEEVTEEIDTPTKKKKRKNNKANTDIDNDEKTNTTADVKEIIETNKKNKLKVEAISINEVSSIGPSQEASEVCTFKNKKKNNQKDGECETKQNGRVETITDDISIQNNVSKSKERNLKRKADFKDTEHNVSKKKKGVNTDCKKKFNQNGAVKNKPKRPVNPLTNLSDERLKAFGLNPKKYKNFLHFKKY